MLPVRDNVPARHPPLTLWLIIGLNVLVYAVEARLSERHLNLLFAWLAVTPYEAVTNPSPRTLLPFLTSQFLHGGLGHLLGNMWMLWLFGNNVEDRMGPGRFLTFYLLCGVLASATHVFLNPTSLVPTLGASGAIAGVMGAYLVLYPRAEILLLVPVFIFPFFFNVPAWLFLGGWFLMQFLMGEAARGDTAEAGIAFWAHVGGFVAGLVLWPLFLRPPERRPLYVDEYGLDAAWAPRRPLRRV